ncbi:MAG: hypothetical protein N2450_01375 [bacterium]|nr:hypothetical protein [bacterium]
MPTYEYQCEVSAEHRYEKMQKFSDPMDTHCPFCGQPVRRIISGGVGLIFSGNGFYQTDYKNNHSKNGKSATKKEEKSETKTENNLNNGNCGSNCSCH